MRAHVAGDQRIAVGRGALRARRSGGAAGPDDVLDHDLLPKGARHMLADDARDHVGRPAGREWNDECDVLGRIILRRGRHRRQCERHHSYDGTGNFFYDAHAFLHPRCSSALRLLIC
jgi:hypothetical protein